MRPTAQELKHNGNLTSQWYFVVFTGNLLNRYQQQILFLSRTHATTRTLVFIKLKHSIRTSDNPYDTERLCITGILPQTDSTK